jgi:predicted nucleic acid-binding protein
MSWLVDTNVLSELRRVRPDPRIASWITERQESVFLSVLTIGELEKGIRMQAEKSKRQRLERWLEADVLPWFTGRILVIDEEVSRAWGRIAAEAVEPLPVIDALIGATALTHDLTVATRNVRDIARTGARNFQPLGGAMIQMNVSRRAFLRQAGATAAAASVIGAAGFRRNQARGDYLPERQRPSIASSSGSEAARRTSTLGIPSASAISRRWQARLIRPSTPRFPECRCVST